MIHYIKSDFQLNSNLIIGGNTYFQSSEIQPSSTLDIDMANRVGIESSRFVAIMPFMVASNRGMSEIYVFPKNDSKHIITVKNEYTSVAIAYISVMYFYK